MHRTGFTEGENFCYKCLTHSQSLGQSGGQATVSRTRFKTILQFKGLSLAQILGDRCQGDAPTPTAIRSCPSALPQSSSPARHPDDTSLTAQQSLGLQVNFRETG